MIAKLLDLRICNFTEKNSTEEVKGYRSSFIIPSRHPEQYSPTIVSFFTCEDDHRGFGLELKKILADSEYMTSLDGLGDYEIGYKYNPEKKLQTLTFLKKT